MKTTIAQMRIIDAVVQTIEEDCGRLVLREAQLTPLPDAVQSVDVAYRELLPAKDGWGNPYWVTVVDKQLVVLSSGPDGLIDGSADIESLVKWFKQRLDHEGDDIVFSKFFRMRPKPEWARQARTIADMRTAATTIKIFRLETGEFPRSAKFRDLSELKAEFGTALDIGSVPTTDAWGKAFLYWSDGKDYLIVSLGADGMPDKTYREMTRPFEEVDGGFYSCPSNDIIMSHGKLVLRPRGFDG